MPAQKPRRVFARSFVVTIAAAALPACGAEPGFAPNPPQPTATTPEPGASAPAASNAPIPDPITSPGVVASARAKIGQSWTVTKTKDTGKCEAMDADSGGCPPGDNCNPPPPRAYDCPKDAHDFPITVTQASDTKKCTMTYVQYHHVDCPPPKRCNPPPPSEVTVDVPCPQ